MDYEYEEEEKYMGIDKDQAHPIAIALFPDDFFWDQIDDRSPFGSDRAFEALSAWREDNEMSPETPMIDYMKESIEVIGGIKAEEYNEKLLDPKLIKTIWENMGMFDRSNFFTLDISVIAIGFGQLAYQGKIDPEIRPYILVAIDRQLFLQKNYHQEDEIYTNNLNRLKEVVINLDELIKNLPKNSEKPPWLKFIILICVINFTYLALRFIIEIL